MDNAGQNTSTRLGGSCNNNNKAKVIPVVIGLFHDHSDNTRATYLESTKLRGYKNSHVGQCTHTTESSNVKYKTYFMGGITLHVA